MSPTPSRSWRHGRRHRGVDDGAQRERHAVDLGTGADTLTFGERRQQPQRRQHRGDPGGSGADTVVLTTALSGGTIDLGGGADTLTLSSAGANSLQVATPSRSWAAPPPTPSCW